jgi:hypothetical protein
MIRQDESMKSGKTQSIANQESDKKLPTGFGKDVVDIP